MTLHFWVEQIQNNVIVHHEKAICSSHRSKSNEDRSSPAWAYACNVSGWCIWNTTLWSSIDWCKEARQKGAKGITLLLIQMETCIHWCSETQILHRTRGELEGTWWDEQQQQVPHRWSWIESAIWKSQHILHSMGQNNIAFLWRWNSQQRRGATAVQHHWIHSWAVAAFGSSKIIQRVGASHPSRCCGCIARCFGTHWCTTLRWCTCIFDNLIARCCAHCLIITPQPQQCLWTTSPYIKYLMLPYSSLAACGAH